MPIFDYVCQNCGRLFEELVSSASNPDSEIECPFCHTHQAQRRISAPSIGTNSASSSTGNISSACGSSGFT